MKRFAQTVLLAAAAGLLAASCALHVDPSGRVPQPEEAAPPLEAFDQAGSPITLASVTAGGAGVVIFYRGHW